MTIAELLVQTTATLLAGVEKEDYTPSPKDIEYAQGNARTIVAAIYGEPCNQAWKIRQIPVQHPDERPEYTVFYDLKPAEQCEECGWPRSQHKTKP